MITVRRANERHHEKRHRRQEAWLTFCPQDPGNPLGAGFGALQRLNEDRLPPGGRLPRQTHEDAEIITYVHEGALAYQDSLGSSGVIQTGEFQRMTAGRGVRHSLSNASRTDWAQTFQIWLRPWEADLAPTYEQSRFSAAQRHGLLCVIASPDGRRGSLRIQQDALAYSAILDPGQHPIHELLPGRTAWLHLITGEVTLGDLVLITGSGAGFVGERAISLTARKLSEILLIDLGAQPPEGRGSS